MTEPTPRRSLLAGRSSQPLEDRQVRAVVNTFAGLDYSVPNRHDDSGITAFRVETDDEGETYGIVTFGTDIYPGTGLLDPNSALSMRAAVAHEISHYYRWVDRSALPEDELEFLDEAMTSLDAALRFGGKLSDHEIQQLIRDAFQRLQMYYNALGTVSDAAP